MALMSYPNMPAIAYKGFGGFLEKENVRKDVLLLKIYWLIMRLEEEIQFIFKHFVWKWRPFSSQLEKKKN